MTLPYGGRLLTIGTLWAFVTGLNVALLPARYMPRVGVEAIQPGSLPLVVRAPATLEAKQSFTFKAEFDGPVLAKHFIEGKPVQKGQLLMVLGRDRIQMDYDSKSDAFHNARADLIKAEREVKLQKALFKRQAVAHSNVDDAERDRVHATQALRSAEEAFRLEQQRWNKNKLYAPFSGMVMKDSVKNEPIVSSGKEILTLADVSGYTVRAQVDELEIGQIHEGQKAEVHIEAFSKALLHARVSHIGSPTDEKGPLNIPVDLLLENIQGLPLSPKLTADVRILAGQTGPVLSVPLTAIANEDGKTKVWILTDSNRLLSRPVMVGRSNPDRVEISQGLKAGDRVCAQADPHFVEGMKVDAKRAVPSHE